MDLLRRAFVALLAYPPLVSAPCEPHCAYPCVELNGPLHIECGDCSAASGLCYPGADDFDTWKERADALRGGQVRASVDGYGNQGMVNAPVDDITVAEKPVELTHKSMVMRDQFYRIASPKRTEAFSFDLITNNSNLAEFLDWPSTVPEESPRVCEVHSCVLIEGDDACAEGRAECTDVPKGHLRPFGEQMELLSIDEYDVSSDWPRVDAPFFWGEHIMPYKPVVLRGGAAAITNLKAWTDERLLGRAPPNPDGSPGARRCEIEDGRPFYVIVEKNNRVSHNDRLPLQDGWDFCKFLREYRKPDAPTYVIQSITEDRTNVGLLRTLGLPEVFACDDLYRSLHGIRMWMSRGNTTSSQHFDTHDNMMLQIDGTKDIYLAHPNESSLMYMDHHDKYGISPINVDRVDMQRFPKLAQAKVRARVSPSQATS
jgi:hypothetical protein